MRTVMYVLLAMILAAWAVGCANDPHSRRRIELRRQNLDDTLRSAQKREDTGPARLQRAGDALESWWRQDEIEFADGLERAGDRIW